MAATESTTPRPVQSQQGTFSLTEFRELCHHRDCMAYQAVGGIETAIAKLNLGESKQATEILLGVLERYQTANAAIDSFRKEHYADGHAAA